MHRHGKNTAADSVATTRRVNKLGILRALMAMENQTRPLKASLLDNFGHIQRKLRPERCRSPKPVMVGEHRAFTSNVAKPGAMFRCHDGVYAWTPIRAVTPSAARLPPTAARHPADKVRKPRSISCWVRAGRAVESRGRLPSDRHADLACRATASRCRGWWRSWWSTAPAAPMPPAFWPKRETRTVE
jgi:hypothetical protein